MIERLACRILLLLLSGQVVVPLCSAEPEASRAAEKSALSEMVEKSDPVFHPIAPGPDDGRIAFVTAKMLEQYQYLRKLFDASVSSNFFDRYFDALDPQHLHFLQGDLAEFEHYRTNLDRLTIPPPPHGAGDTTPGCEIFNCFVERFSQRVAYADELLKHEKFTFDTDERITINRHEMPYPKDLAEAKKLWRERLRYEYLQEKLGRIDAAKKPVAADTKPEAPPVATNALPAAPTAPLSVKPETHTDMPALPVQREADRTKPAESAAATLDQARSSVVQPADREPGVGKAVPSGSTSLPAAAEVQNPRYGSLHSPKGAEQAPPMPFETRGVRKGAVAALQADQARPQTEASAKPAAETKAQAVTTEQERPAADQARTRAEAEAKRSAEQERSKAEAQARVTPAASQAAVPSGKQAGTKAKSEAEEIVETLSHRYHRTLRMYTDWNNEDVLQVYLNALTHVYDPHSDYMGHAQLEGFSIGMNLSLFGIGAQLLSQDGYCSITKLLPGGPALKSHMIKEKDRIIAVAQSNQPPVDIVDMSLNKAVQLIRGPKGTEVRLTIIPAGAEASSRKVVSLIRDEIPLEESAAKAKLIVMPNGRGGKIRLGVIDLPSFYAPFPFDPNNVRDKSEPKNTTTADVAKLLRKLEQESIDGLILDLRRNGGGSLEEAIRLTGLFIKEGPVVQVRDFLGHIEHQDDRDPSVLYEGPLLVLTSRFSASASEIVAGALQDYGRALLVGDISTHGKGTVQQVNPLQSFLHPGDTNDPGAVKITIKKFYRPSGASTQKDGVTPDIVLPSIWNESKEVGESALDNPLPWDTVPSARYDHLNLVEPYLPMLRRRSARRLAVAPEFAYVREDIEQIRKAQADKTISLNEKLRLKEKEEAEARQKARDKERLARREPPETVYDLTLKQVDLPGLPPPVQRTNSVLARVSNPEGTLTSGISTNSASITPGPAPADRALGEDAEGEKPPSADATLDEAEHILVDYYSVFPKHNLAQAAH